MNTPQCYYGCQEPEDRPDELWQCETCHEWYCYDHWHETGLGRCVECVACEHARRDTEGDKVDDEKTYTVTFKGCTIEVYGVIADMEEEAIGIAEEDLREDLRRSNPHISFYTGNNEASEE